MKCFMYSGQGAQYVGMGKELYDNFESAKNVFDQADQILGYKLSEIIFNDEDKLNDTKYTQVAMFTLEAAITAVLTEKNITASNTCGLSLGEYGAYYYSEVFDFETGLKLLEKRGQFMNEAASKTEGKMSAILGLDADVIKELCDNASSFVGIANYNTYGQIVISGTKEGVLEVNEKALEAGAKRAILLNTSGAFHTKLMDEARVKLGEYLESVSVNEPVKDLYVNVTGDLYNGNVKDNMTSQITGSVMFYQMIEKMIEKGVDTFIEIGPKSTLCSFVKKINRKLTILNVEDLASLEKTLSKLEAR